MIPTRMLARFWPVLKLGLSYRWSDAQFERSLIRERQREDIAVAKAKGDVYLGRTLL